MRGTKETRPSIAKHLIESPGKQEEILLQGNGNGERDNLTLTFFIRLTTAAGFVSARLLMWSRILKSVNDKVD